MQAEGRRFDSDILHTVAFARPFHGPRTTPPRGPSARSGRAATKLFDVRRREEVGGLRSLPARIAKKLRALGKALPRAPQAGVKEKAR